MKLKTIYRVSLPLLGVLAFFNVCLSAWVFFRARRPVEYNVQVIEPPRFDPPAATNHPPPVRSGLLPERNTLSPQVTTPVEPVPSPPSHWSGNYHYCVAGGRRAAVFNGIVVREGDEHAYGVVRRIFPERIYFAGGDYIDNTQNRRFDYESDNPTAGSVP